AVEGDELLPLQLEGHRHDRPRLARPGLAVAGDLGDLRASGGGARLVREHRDVEVRGLLRLVVEPQERRDLLHGGSSFVYAVDHETTAEGETHRSTDDPSSLPSFARSGCGHRHQEARCRLSTGGNSGTTEQVRTSVTNVISAPPARPVTR